jgi:hypothetical protein
MNTWIGLVNLKMAFVAVAAFVDTSSLKGKVNPGAADILDLELPYLSPLGIQAREKFEKALEEAAKTLTPEELENYLQDMATSVFYIRGGDHNIFNQVSSFLRLFNSDEDENVHRPLKG